MADIEAMFAKKQCATEIELDKLRIEIQECKLQELDYLDEPNDIQPFTESRRDVRTLKQHKIWDYG